jgi:hypothetical protein
LPGFRWFPQAEAAVAEFGGLTMERLEDRGLECAPSSFDTNPMLASGEDEYIAAYEDRSGEPLFPLGEVEHGYAYLVVGESGRVYMIFDRLLILGESMREAIDGLVVGRLPRELS